MQTSLPQGTYVPLITPFTEQGEIDFTNMGRLIDRLLRANVEAIVVLGTTGESPTVSGQESAALIQYTVNRVAGSVAVLAGVGSNNTRTSVEQACAATELGVDGLLVVCPYYSRPTQRGLYEHFRTIAEQVPVPQIVYNIDGRTGVNIETETLLKLAELPAIAGVKESSDSIDQASEVLMQLPEDFLVLSGCDHLSFPMLCLGGHGVISTVANVIPETVKAMVDAVLNNDIRTARRLHFEMEPLIAGCSMETNPIPVKTALAMMGVVKEEFRSPLCMMAPRNRGNWFNVLEQQGLINNGDNVDLDLDKYRSAGLQTQTQHQG